MQSRAALGVRDDGAEVPALSTLSRDVGPLGSPTGRALAVAAIGRRNHVSNAFR